VFGLAVTGKVKKENLKRNDTARADSLLYLTKPLGIGIITTAQKKGIVLQEHYQRAVDAMLTLNVLGSVAGNIQAVSAMTDVTGFGLLGHLAEVCEGSGLSAEIEFDKIPKFDFLDHYLQQKSFPGGTLRNWESYGTKINSLSEQQKLILADPQTSGGLLMAVDSHQQRAFESHMKSLGYDLKPFGKLVKKTSHLITVK
jgi:selenide,water dikinase